jgi:hypothetical protein
VAGNSGVVTGDGLRVLRGDGFYSAKLSSVAAAGCRARFLSRLSVDVDELIAEITAAGFRELPVTNTHAAAVRHLPNHHRDPFDRLLIAQAITEPLRLLSADEHVWKYSDLVIRV